LVVLAPVLGIVQSGPQLVADKYSYVSCIGWAVLVGGVMLSLWCSRRPAAKRWAGGLAAVAVGVVVTLFALAYQQTGVWHDSKSLWEHALAVGHESTTAHLNLGILLREAGQTDEAVAHYRRAVELKPSSGAAWFALGNALKFRRDFAGAEEAYLEAVKFMAQRQRAYLNLGNMYYNNLRRPDDAIAAYRAAIAHIESTPAKVFSPRPYLALGIALRAKGDVQGAREALSLAKKHRQTRVRAEQELAAIDQADGH
jgi:tetratricopeptide (TPR) repeat protein